MLLLIRLLPSCLRGAGLKQHRWSSDGWIEDTSYKDTSKRLDYALEPGSVMHVGRKLLPSPVNVPLGSLHVYNEFGAMTKIS